MELQYQTRGRDFYSGCQEQTAIDYHQEMFKELKISMEWKRVSGIVNIKNSSLVVV